MIQHHKQCLDAAAATRDQMGYRTRHFYRTAKCVCVVDAALPIGVTFAIPSVFIGESNDSAKKVITISSSIVSL